jgi:hypothetical protein
LKINETRATFNDPSAQLIWERSGENVVFRRGGVFQDLSASC